MPTSPPYSLYPIWLSNAHNPQQNHFGGGGQRALSLLKRSYCCNDNHRFLKLTVQSYLVKSTWPLNNFLINFKYLPRRCLGINPPNFHFSKSVIIQYNPIYNIQTCFQFPVFIKGHFNPSTIVESDFFQIQMKLDKMRSKILEYIVKYVSHEMPILCIPTKFLFLFNYRTVPLTISLLPMKDESRLSLVDSPIVGDSGYGWCQSSTTKIVVHIIDMELSSWRL